MPAADDFSPLGVAVLTVSDTRTAADDASGDYLSAGVVEAGHSLVDRAILTDDIYLLRAKVSAWIADPRVQVVLVTGGTGFTGRDVSPEALEPLFDKKIEGFGELFRQLSYAEIGVAALQSRAYAGLANATLVFGMPGSTGACRTGWERIIRQQIDARSRPCNFATLLPRFNER